MWILRFHLLRSKDYNKIARICKKYGFSPRQISPIVFAKAVVIYKTQKKSWRMVGRELSVSHIPLYKFYESAQKSNLLQEIFHVFSDRRIALYLGDRKHIKKEDLDNSKELGELTRREIESMLLQS